MSRLRRHVSAGLDELFASHFREVDLFEHALATQQTEMLWP